MGRATGAVTEEQLRELDRYEQSDAFSPLEKLVLDLATRLSQTPVEVPDALRTELRRHLTEAQLDGRACIRCGHQAEVGEAMRPVEAWSEQSAQLFECDDVEACHERAGTGGLPSEAS